MQLRLLDATASSYVLIRNTAENILILTGL